MNKNRCCNCMKNINLEYLISCNTCKIVYVKIVLE